MVELSEILPLDFWQIHWDERDPQTGERYPRKLGVQRFIKVKPHQTKKRNLLFSSNGIKKSEDFVGRF
jgi:hypothetical protein